MPENPPLPKPEQILGGGSKKLPSPDQVLNAAPAQYSNPAFDYLDSQEGLSSAYSKIDSIPDLHDGQRDVLKNLVKRGGTKEDISTTLGALQSGDKFYMNDRGVAIRLKPNERPPKEYDVASMWGTQEDADKDNGFTTVAKQIYNILPSLAENAIDLVHLPYGAIVGKEADWYKTLKNSADYLKVNTSNDSKQSPLDVNKVHDFSDIFKGDNWDFTPENVAGLIGQVTKSVGEFALGGLGVGKLAGLTAKSSKAAKMGAAFTGSYMTQLGELIDAGKNAGLETGDAYKLGAAITVPIAAVDILSGAEGKILSDFVMKPEAKEFTHNMVKGLTESLKKDGGKLTAEELDKAFKVTLQSVAGMSKTWAKETAETSLSEAGQEATQSFMEKAGHQLYDKFSDKDKAKFGGDTFGPKAVADYVNEAVGGLLGGAQAGFAINKVKAINKDNNQSKTAFGIVQPREGETLEQSNDRINTYKANIQNEVRNGNLTKEEGDAAITRINSYKEYNEITSSLELDPAKKREVFDKTFQKQNLESEMEGMGDPAKLNALRLAEYQAKEKLAKDLQKDISEATLEAMLKREKVVGKKTIDDQIKKREKAKEEAKPENIAKAPKMPVELRAIVNRNKNDLKDGIVEDKRTYDQVPNKEFNKSSFNSRKKHQLTYDSINALPGKRTEATAIQREVDWDGKGKVKKNTPNTVFEAKMKDGKMIRFASSVFRGDEWGRGWLEMSGNLPKSIMNETAPGVFSIDESKLEGKPIGLKAVKIENNEKGKPDKRAIKIYYKQPGPDYGKFIGWAKQTHTGKSDFAGTEIDQLQKEEKLTEDDSIGGSPSQTPGPAPVNNSGPVQPLTGNNVQPEINTPQNEQAGRQDNNEQNQPEGAGESGQAATQEEPEGGNNNQAVRAPSEAPVEEVDKTIRLLRKKITHYNSLFKKTKKEAEGQQLLAEIANQATQIGYAIRRLKTDANIDLLDDTGKKVVSKGKIRSAGEIQADKDYKAKRMRALNMAPVSVEHAVVMDIANGVQFKRDEYERMMGHKDADIPTMLFTNNKDKAQTFEHYYESLQGKDPQFDISEENAGAIAEKAVQTVAEFAQSDFLKAATKKAIEIMDQLDGVNPNEKAKIEEMEALQKEAELTVEENEADKLLSNVDPKLAEMVKAHMAELDEEDLEFLAQEDGRFFNEWLDAIDKRDRDNYIEVKKRHLKEMNGADYDSANDRVYDAYFGKQYDRIVDKTLEPGKDIVRSTEDAPFQKESSKTKDGDAQKVVEAMQKALPKVKIVYDPTLKAAGKKEGNTILINPYRAGKDTAIHEAGHVLIDAIGYDNKVIQAAIKQLKDTDLWKETAAKYPELNERELGIEVLAEAIGREGADIFDTEQQKSNFKVFLDYIFDWLKRNLGIEKNVAKNLARQIIQGHGTKEMTGKSDTEYQQKESKSKSKFNEYRKNVLNRNIEEEKADLAELKRALKEDDLSSDEADEIESAIEGIYQRREEDRADFEENEVISQTMAEIAESEDLSEFTLDELIKTYNEIEANKNKFDKKLLEKAKLRIANFIQNREMDRLAEAKPEIDKIANSKDMTWTQVWFKTLSDVSEKFPLLQGLSKEFDKRYLAKAQEVNAKKKKHERLGKAVIKDANKSIYGVISDKFKTDSSKYFEFVEDNGTLRTNTTGLSTAQKNYLEFITELVKNRNDLMDADGNLIDNTLIQMDKGFQESFRTEGLLSALNVYLGGNNNTDTTVKYTNPNTFIEEEASYLDAQKVFLDYGKQGNFFQALWGLIKLAYQAAKEKENGNYKLNYRGALTSKFDRPRPEGKGWSKDYYKAAMHYIDDSAHVSNMSDLVPIVKALDLFYEKMGLDGDNKKDFSNTRKFLQEWGDEQIYQHKKVTEPSIDFMFKTLRGLTSKMVMAFNVPANVMNVMIGNYSNWRAESAAMMLTGNKRLFGNMKKSLAVLKHFDVVSPDLDSNPKPHIGRLFDNLAYAGNAWGEYQIQGSMFLGQISDHEWDQMTVNKDGEVEFKNVSDQDYFNEQMIKYRNRVSDIQGKYALKDRRNFMRFEAGRAASQFKTFIPDLVKERIGKNFIDKNNIKRGGSWRVFTGEAFKELKADIDKYGYTKALWNNKAFMANLKGLMVTATLMVAAGSDDDDEETKRKTLSVENGLSNMLFIVDPHQALYLLESPVAGIGSLKKLMQATEALMDGDVEKFEKTGRKLLPYGKAIDVAEYMTDKE